MAYTTGKMPWCPGIQKKFQKRIRGLSSPVRAATPIDGSAIGRVRQMWPMSSSPSRSHDFFQRSCWRKKVAYSWGTFVHDSAFA